MSRTPAVARFVALSSAAVALAFVATPMTFADAAGHGKSLRAELIDRAHGHATFRPGHGAAGVFFGTEPGHAASRPAGITAQDEPATAAAAWMRSFGAAFGVRDAAHDLRPTRTDVTPGGSVVHLQQSVSGLPVVGGEISVVLDDANQLVSATGHVSPDTTRPADPVLTDDQAAALAVRAVARHEGDARHLSATRPALSVLDARVLDGVDLPGPATVWATTVSSPDHVVRHDVYVEATRGGIVLDIDDNPQASRVVCTAGGARIGDPTCPGPEVVTVSSPGTSKDTDTVNAYRFAGAVDGFYSQLLQRRSLDNHDMELASTVHYCPLRSDPDDNVCPYDNAFWDGHEMVYGAGYASGLDVVGHEMTHGVTEHTSHLFSYYQSGAINESESDVMGELIQQITGPGLNAPGKTDVYDDSTAWQVGEDLAAFGGPFRYMNDPTADNPSYVDPFTHTTVPADPDPDSMTSRYYHASSDDSGDVHANAGVGNKAAYLIARGAPGGTFNGVDGITGVTGDGIMSTVPNSGGLTEDAVVKDVKTANIYYLLDKMMVGATTYADLYKLLPQACDALVGKSRPMPTGGYTVTTATISTVDCQQVRLAVQATRMNLQPSKAGAVIAAPSPYCTNGGSATSRRTDAFETSPFAAGSYKRGHNTATNTLFGYRTGQVGAWWWTKDYQQAGSAASIWGEDTDPTGVSPRPSAPSYSYEDARVQKQRAVHAAVGTYVRFRSVWGFESETFTSGSRRITTNFDGGVMEYSIDGGRRWRDAGPLFANNGYNGRITNTGSTGYVDPNPLKGRRGFVRSSHGWTASRLDLSSLSGHAVLLRWRIGADEEVGDLGWLVDNVQSYTCNPTHVAISAPAKVAGGRSARVDAHLVRTGTRTALRNLPVVLWEKRHSGSRWTPVSTHLTNRYGNVHWWRAHSVAYDYRVRMPGQKPFAPSNYARTTVRVG